jgi:hypothetical protein
MARRIAEAKENAKEKIARDAAARKAGASKSPEPDDGN